MSENILEVSGLCKSYPGFALNNVSFSLPYGRIMGFIGENGAGKSTTIKLLLGIIGRDSGSVKLFGQELSENELSIKQRVGVVFDECRFHLTLTPNDVGRFMKHIYSAWDEREYKRNLERFGLQEKKTIKDMSRGMKMKLSLAAALSHNAELLILDEPSGGLDPVVRDELLDVYLDFIGDERHSIFVSSHITTDLEKVADYITFINKGSVFLSEEKDTLLEKYCVLKCSQTELEALPQAAILGHRSGRFGAEALIERSVVPKDAVIDKASLEDIMLFSIKGRSEQ